MDRARNPMSGPSPANVEEKARAKSGAGSWNPASKQPVTPALRHRSAYPDLRCVPERQQGGTRHVATNNRPGNVRRHDQWWRRWVLPFQTEVRFDCASSCSRKWLTRIFQRPSDCRGRTKRTSARGWRAAICTYSWGWGCYRFTNQSGMRGYA